MHIFQLYEMKHTDAPEAAAFGMSIIIIIRIIHDDQKY